MEYHQKREANWGLRNKEIDNLLKYKNSINYLKNILNKNFINYCLNKIKDIIIYYKKLIKEHIENKNIETVFSLSQYNEEKICKLFNKAFPQFRGLKTALYGEKMKDEKESEFFKRSANYYDCYVVLWFPDDAEWIGSRNGKEATKKKRFKHKDTYFVFNDANDKYKASGDNVINNDISVKEENRL